MQVRHHHRGNEKKANVGEARAEDIGASNSDNKGASLQHNKIDDHNRCWREKQQQKPAQEVNKQQFDRADTWNEKASEKVATLDDVTSPDMQESPKAMRRPC